MPSAPIVRIVATSSWFHADGAAPGTIHEMESYHGMLACVIAGAGIALIPRSMLESMPGHHQVEAWPLAEQWRWLTTWLVWRRGAKTRPLRHLFNCWMCLTRQDRDINELFLIVLAVNMLYIVMFR